MHRSTERARLPALLLLLALTVTAPPAAHAAARELAQAFVTEPYLELHTGPGRGFPVSQVVGRGESVDVVLLRTSWFLVRTERGYEGWASEADMAHAKLADGSPFKFNHGDRDGFRDHRWEGGIMAGAYGGATLVEGFAARSLTEHLKLELAVGQFLGNLSNGYVADLGLNHVFAPQWRFSPFVTVGMGYERSEPKATLVQPVVQDLQSAYEGIGGRYYLARRFYLRGEYRHHTVFTHTDSNEVKQEWKLGFAFFY
ncbi:MAG: hypothetical protein RL684_204 [Pseudomonadota bacterium]|jgi:hypothetical protein